MPSPHTAAASQTATGRGTHVSHTARHRRMCAPRAGRVYGWASVVLAAAHDAEGGWLGSSKIVWRSSIDGAIATGAYAVVTTEDLTAGTHTITATATDSDNTAGSASVTVIVRATNDAPAAADDVLRAVLGRGVDLAVLANDADTEGDIFTTPTPRATSSPTPSRCGCLRRWAKRAAAHGRARSATARPTPTRERRCRR